VSDQLYLSLWFPRFDEPDMLRHAAAVMRQFAFSEQRPGVTYLAMHPISWSEPTVFEKRFEPPVQVEEAVTVAAEFLRSDQACVFSVFWDLWVPEPQSGTWHLTPVSVKFVVQGEKFEEESAEETGQVQIEFGLDTPFLYEDARPRSEADQRVRLNIQKLVEFTIKIEKNSGATGRVLWSESEDNLAQKLIQRLQRVQ
jgi:hypothetical protein